MLKGRNMDGLQLWLGEWESIFSPYSQKVQNEKEKEIFSLSKDEEKKKAIRILLVDDEPVTREIFGGILIEEGFTVTKAKCGEEAIDKLRENHFQIALLDIKLPDINGVEVYKMLKKISPKTVAIMITAYSVENLIREALELGAYTCVYKPFNINEILDLLKKISTL